jgi:hypothetical protein
MKNYISSLDKNGPHVVGYVNDYGDFVEYLRVNNFDVAAKKLKQYREESEKRSWEIRYIPVTEYDKFKYEYLCFFPQGKAGFCEGLSRKDLRSLMLRMGCFKKNKKNGFNLNDSKTIYSFAIVDSSLKWKNPIRRNIPVALRRIGR